MKVQHRFSDSLFLFRSFLFPLFLLAVLISPSPAQAAEEVFFYHNDAVGSPVAMTDSTGAIVWEADYQPFGDEWNLSETKTNAHRFTGKERDAETGLHYFGARHYDANLGRFISIDPALISGRPASTLTVPQQHNFYAYAINNPYRYVDPDGEFAITAAIVLGAIATNAFLPSTVNAPLDDQNLVNSQTTAEFAKDAAILETAGFVGGKVISRFGKVTKTRGDTFERVINNAELSATQKTGLLRGGRKGKNFFTNRSSLDAKRAQQRLGLDGPLRDTRIQFRIKNNVKVTGPKPAVPGKTGTAGGGREFSTNGRTEIEIIRITPLKK